MRGFPVAVAWVMGILLVSPHPLSGAERDGEWVDLFNGEDLSGWVNVNCAPDTFTVRDGMIYCTGFPTGVLRTERMYENFVLELEWKHIEPRGNAGLFIWSDGLTAPGVPFTRSIECQVLDGRNGPAHTSQGDMFAIHGAVLTPDRPHPFGAMRCLPAEWTTNPAGEWNHYRVVANDGELTLIVNGKAVSGGYAASPRKGYICLESEGAPIWFRNIRVKELPSTNAAGEQVAEEADGWRTLYTGVDLAGWRRDAGHEGHWTVRDWILDYDGASEAEDKNLWTDESFGDFELIVDWRWTGEPEMVERPVILPSGEQAVDDDGNPEMREVPDAGDSGIYLRGTSKAQVNIWCWPVGSGEVYGYRTDESMPAEVRRAVTPRVNADHPIGRWNRFEITMAGERLTVVLNGETVIEDARLPDVPRRGPIALQHHGDPIQFANIMIRERDK